jgi:hypothetical protein
VQIHFFLNDKIFIYIHGTSTIWLLNLQEKKTGMSWLAKLPWDPQSCWSGRHVINTIRAWSLALKRDYALISFPWARLSLFFPFPFGTRRHHQSTLRINFSPTLWDLTLNPLYLLKSLPSKTDKQNICCYTDFIPSLIWGNLTPKCMHGLGKNKTYISFKVYLTI